MQKLVQEHQLPHVIPFHTGLPICLLRVTLRDTFTIISRNTGVEWELDALHCMKGIKRKRSIFYKDMEHFCSLIALVHFVLPTLPPAPLCHSARGPALLAKLFLCRKENLPAPKQSLEAYFYFHVCCTLQHKWKEKVMSRDNDISPSFTSVG